MRRTNLTMNEAISIRPLTYRDVRPTLRKAWVGMCEEVLTALEGDEDHICEIIDGRRVIWRRGYTYPHFIEVESSAFCCPFWQ